MPKLLTDNGELVVQVERNKVRVKVGIEEPSAWSCRDTGGYAERWLSTDQVTWLIGRLQTALGGATEFASDQEVRAMQRRAEAKKAVAEHDGNTRPRTSKRHGNWDYEVAVHGGKR